MNKLEMNGTFEEMETREKRYLYCLDCREYPDVVIEVRKWGECNYEPLCAKCGSTLDWVD